ncbi:MAG: class I SAM-dependent methyltransferase [Bacteroidales bacterium]|nr:class I SAM-dependent methyltransferase [Bacteroidales bacterium]
MAYNFDTIASNYDRMNRLMTLGLDRSWRKRAVRELSVLHSSLSALDVACGTGDMAVSLAKRGCTVTGVDLSEEMLAIAKQKTTSANFQFSIFN